MTTWKILPVLCMAAAVAIGAPDAMAVTYYVDNSSASANDGNTGTSQAAAWRTIARVNAQPLQPGDSVLFKAGTSYTGHVYIRSSGTQANLITIGNYGTGTAPIIRNPGTWTIGITIDANWVKVTGFLLRDVHETGVRIATGRQNNIVENCEIVNAGLGVQVLGPYNLVRHNYAHDLTMIRNTVGGDDDYGAVGFWIEGTNNEVAYNRCVRCKASSFDYGMDGGLVEIYGNGDNNSIHHNWAQDSNSFFEVSKGSARNITIAYNVSVNNAGYFGGVHGESLMQNFRVENNTIIDTQYATPSLIWGAPNEANFLFRNNIVMVSQVKAIFARPVTRANNLYYFTAGQGQIVAGSTALASGEQLGNPLFVDQTGLNFRLQPNSPAINRGLYLGYTRDYDHMAVPSGSAPDLGVYEFTGQVSQPGPSPPNGVRIF
jgi:hypothetical protein